MFESYLEDVLRDLDELPRPGYVAAALQRRMTPPGDLVPEGPGRPDGSGASFFAAVLIDILIAAYGPILAHGAVDMNRMLGDFCADNFARLAEHKDRIEAEDLTLEQVTRALKDHAVLYVDKAPGGTPPADA